MGLLDKLKGAFKSARKYGKTVSKYGKKAQKMQGDFFDLPSGDFDFFGTSARKKKRSKRKNRRKR